MQWNGRSVRFTDRRAAGRQLAAILKHLKSDHTIILGLPRGGVPVAFEVARALDAPLDIALVRKIGAPHQPEVGIGAVVDGSEPKVVLNTEMVRMVGATQAYIDAEAQRELAELERRRHMYRGNRYPPRLEGSIVVLVDDGVATGATMRAVLEGIAQYKPERLVLAVPVAPADALVALRSAADEIVCLATPEPFYAVGLHYDDFDQTGDDEVIALLGAAKAPA
jgi:putative phosphoribosyl transferase